MLATFCAGACVSLNADSYSDFQTYKAGDSLAWFYDLSDKAIVKTNAAEIQSKLLSILAKEKVSDGAFNRACEILKFIATDDCVQVLSRFLDDEIRAPWVCDVFLAINDDYAFDALAKKLPSATPKTAMSIISTLAKSGDDDYIKDIAKFANSQDKQLAKFAVCALAKYTDDDAVEVLAPIAKKADFRANAAYEALSMIAFDAARKGDKPLAKQALKAVPENFGMSIVARAMVADDKMAYLDSLIIADGENVDEAGRAIHKSRKFENSQKLIDAFPKLSKRAQLAAMSTFMLSGDCRFYPTIAPLLDSKDSDLRDEAIYAARFICADEALLLKIYPLMNDGRRITKGLARNVFAENPSRAAAKILKEKEAEGDMLAFEILINRGDVPSRDKLMKMFLEGGYKDSKISNLLENVIVAGELPALAKNLKSDNEALRKAIVKIIIKKLAKTRDDLYMGEAAYEILNGNLDPKDPLYKFIEQKLKSKIMKRRDVWQSEYRNRAVPDAEMKVAKKVEPDTKNGFVSLFDGKTLDGWKVVGNAKFFAKDGCIMGEVVKDMKANSFLVTERSDYKNFIFTFEFKWFVHGNSGVLFRGYFNGDRPVGPQAEMDDNIKRRWSAGIYEEGKKWRYSLSREDQESARNAVNIDGWNKMTIECVGDKMRTWLNGVPVSDLVWKDVKAGFIGLQVHQGKKGKIVWRNLKIKEIK